MSHSSRKGILPPAAPDDGTGIDATARYRAHIESEPSSIGPTTSVIPPPPPPRLSLLPSAKERLSSLLPPGARNTIASLLPAARKSMLSMLPVWKPRWRPWSPTRALGAVSAFAVVFGLFFYLAYPRLAKYAHRFYVRDVNVAAVATEPEVTPAAEAPSAEADKNLKREGRSPVAGGVMSIPSAFRSSDGAYDLVVFFHGNTDLVEESFSAAKINTVLIVFNLGIGSGPYEDKFSVPALMPTILERVNTTMEKRGLEKAHLRRLALAGWSAGYGAVERVLEQPGMQDKVDAVILLDGIHVGYMVDGRSLDMLRLKPFTDYAKRAAAGEKLMFITHSNIVPTGYAGTRQTTDALLKEVGMEREKLTDVPAMPTLTSLVGVVAKDRVKPLRPVSQAQKGKLTVRGYTGETPEDHMSHLMQMSVTALPELFAHWAEAKK